MQFHYSVHQPQELPSTATRQVKVSVGWQKSLLFVIFDLFFFGVKSKLITPLFEIRGMVH
jgi:hypothetical protein